MPLHERLMRYLICGLLAATVYMMTAWAVSFFSIIAAPFIAFITSYTVSFALQRRYTFHADGGAKRYLSHGAGMAVIGIITSSIVVGLTMGIGFSANIIGCGMNAVMGFLWSSWFFSQSSRTFPS